eukprot:469791_1
MYNIIFVLTLLLITFICLIIFWYLNNQRVIKEDGMIIIINGAVGVGKSWSGYSLAQRLTNCAFLDGDTYYRNSNKCFRDDDYFENWCKFISVNIDLHAKINKTTFFVISYVFESPKQLSYFKNFVYENTKLTSLNCPVYSLLLTCDYENISKRIINRDIFINKQLIRCNELMKILNNNFINNSNTMIIDTSNLNKEQVVKELINKIQIPSTYIKNSKQC